MLATFDLLSSLTQTLRDSLWLLPGTTQLSMLQQLGAPQDFKGFNSQQFNLALLLRTRVVDTWLWLVGPLRSSARSYRDPATLEQGGASGFGPINLVACSQHVPLPFHIADPIPVTRPLPGSAY